MSYRRCLVLSCLGLLACSDTSSVRTDADAGVEAGLIDASAADASRTELDAAAPADASRAELDAAAPADASRAELDAAALADAEPDAAVEAPAFGSDFESTLPDALEIETDSCALTPSQGYEPLGTDGNRFGPTFLRCLTGSTLTLTLDGLPAHTLLELDFLFAAIDSLDGEGAFPAGDYFRIDLDGTTIFRETFANATPSQVQTFEPSSPEVVLARRVDLGFSGPGGYYTDSAYDMSVESSFDGLAHSSPTAVLTFTLEGTGVQSLDDESWAIDNVRVRVR